MPIYVYRNGKVVRKDRARPKRSNSVLGVIVDEMPATRHMADGQYYTSKAKFRQATKDAGCIEVGNETSTLLKPRKPVEMDRARRRDDIRRAIYELRNK